LIPIRGQPPLGRPNDGRVHPRNSYGGTVKAAKTRECGRLCDLVRRHTSPAASIDALTIDPSRWDDCASVDGFALVNRTAICPRCALFLISEYRRRGGSAQRVFPGNTRFFDTCSTKTQSPARDRRGDPTTIAARGCTQPSFDEGTLEAHLLRITQVLARPPLIILSPSSLRSWRRTSLPAEAEG